MPYIIAKRRKEIMGGSAPRNAGELNFAITCLIRDYVSRENNPRYQDINDAIGALEGAKLEFYRRRAAPYEDIKIEENGDVY